MYNGAKLPPVSVSFSSCPTYTVTFAIYYKESKWHTNETEPISDEQFLQTFANVESGNTLTDEDESITTINDESGREHVKYLTLVLQLYTFEIMSSTGPLALNI